MKLIHVGWITDSIKTLSYFQEKGAEMVVINTQPDFSEHTVPVLPNQIPIDFSPFIHQNRRMSLVKRILGVLTLSGSFDASVTEKWGG